MQWVQVITSHFGPVAEAEMNQMQEIICLSAPPPIVLHFPGLGHLSTRINYF